MPGPERIVHLVGATQDARAPRSVAAMTISSPRNLRDADDLDAVRRTREAPAGARAGLDERLEAEAQAVAVARHRDRVDLRDRAFLLRSDIPGDPRIEAHRRDDALAVAQLEQLLHRLAVSG